MYKNGAFLDEIFTTGYNCKETIFTFISVSFQTVLSFIHLKTYSQKVSMTFCQCKRAEGCE